MQEQADSIVAKRIIDTAQRTIKIVQLFIKGKTAQEIVGLTRANRQLVDYYKRLLKIGGRKDKP